MMKRKRDTLSEPKDSASEGFHAALRQHLRALGWKADHLANKSVRYPIPKDWADILKRNADFANEDIPTFNVAKSAISRSQAYGLAPTKDETEVRPVTRRMINIIAHQLSAFYEAQGDGRYDRGNVEVLLHEFLQSAGFRPVEWAADRWDEIIENTDPASRAVRVGYFNWPGMVSMQRRGNLAIPHGKSVELVNSLLKTLRILGEPQPVELSISDLYDTSLFMRVDIVAPLIGIPARRFAMGYSEPIGRWHIGQNILVHADLLDELSANRAGRSQNASRDNRPRRNQNAPLFAGVEDVPSNRLALFYVQGGVSEMLVDEFDQLGLKNPRPTFREAIETVAVAPSKSADGLIPAFVGDNVACGEALGEYGKLRPVLNGKETVLRPLVFGLPQRSEVIATVNEAVNLMGELKQRYLSSLLPDGVQFPPPHESK